MAPNQILMEGVFDIGRGVFHAKKASGCWSRFSVKRNCGALPSGPGPTSSQHLPKVTWSAWRRSPPAARMLGLGGAAFVPGSPRPGVAIPQCRQHMKRRRVGAAIRDRYANHDVVRTGLGIFGAHIEVAVFIKDAGVDQLELRLVPVPATVLLDEPCIRELGLGILVERLQVGMRGRASRGSSNTPSRPRRGCLAGR